MLGPDYLSRSSPIDEHDFFERLYFDGAEPPILIELGIALTDFAEDVLTELRIHSELNLGNYIPKSHSLMSVAILPQNCRVQICWILIKCFHAFGGNAPHTVRSFFSLITRQISRFFVKLRHLKTRQPTFVMSLNRFFVLLGKCRSDSFLYKFDDSFALQFAMFMKDTKGSEHHLRISFARVFAHFVTYLEELNKKNKK